MISSENLEVLRDFLIEKKEKDILKNLSIKNLTLQLKAFEELVKSVGKDLYWECFEEFFKECPQIKFITWEQYIFEDSTIISEPEFWSSFPSEYELRKYPNLIHILPNLIHILPNLIHILNDKRDKSPNEEFLLEKMINLTCKFIPKEGNHYEEEEKIRLMVFGVDVRVIVSREGFQMEDYKAET